jgi:YVTN family beta-propeller protein
LGDVPGPSGLTASADHLWVSHVGTHCVLRVNPCNGSVSDPIPVGDAPWCLVAYRERLWVANTDAATVSVIDCASAAVVGTWPAASSPHGIAVGDDGVWVGLRRPPALVLLPWN